MITTDFITTYTTGLYSVPESSRPTYNEFRDMFSSGQVKSKEWALSALSPHINGKESIAIVGSWFGTLGLALHYKFPDTNIKLIDIDTRCKEFTDGIFRWNDRIKSETINMFDYSYVEDVVINTSTEHIADLRKWLELIPKGTIVLLQSNNNNKMDGHINCCNSADELKNKAGLENILYSGELIMPMYTRYMVIGTV